MDILNDRILVKKKTPETNGHMLIFFQEKMYLRTTRLKSV